MMARAEKRARRAGPGWLRRHWRDPRWLYLALALAIVVPLYLPLGLGVSVPSWVRSAHAALAAVPDGGRVLLLADYGPAAEPELRPFLDALERSTRARQIGVVSLSLWPAAPPLVDRIFASRESGTEIVNLGFKEGRTVVMQKVGESIPNTFATDARGVPLSRLPLMRGLERLADADLVICVSGGSPGALEWIAQVQGRFVERMVAATTSGLAPDLLPFLRSGQLVGLVDGIAGAAALEKLDGEVGDGHRGLEAQSFAHLVLVLIMLAALASAGLARRGAPQIEHHSSRRAS